MEFSLRKNLDFISRSVLGISLNGELGKRAERGLFLGSEG